MTRNLCSGCQMAEVRKHIRRRGRAGEAEDQAVQDAYGEAVQSLPPVERPRTSRGRYLPKDATFEAAAPPLTAPAAGATQLGASRGLDAFQGQTLANAQRFAVTLALAPSDVNVAQLFYSYAQRTLYAHMRAMMLALDGTKKPPRLRRNPGRSHRKSVRAAAEQNVLLSKALRFIRIYMHEEMIPLALKLGCGKTTIWHIEACNNVIQPHWVEKYARVFALPEARIWQYAAALGEGSSVDGDPVDMVCKFVDVVLRGKPEPSWRGEGLRAKRIAKQKAKGRQGEAEGFWGT